tara:strand:- start:342 stop:551 length:210 start_codon:yes stop_codon:yes gene_type:complete
MLKILPPTNDCVFKAQGDDLLELLCFAEEVEFCFEWISNIDTNLGINFHTICYVNENFYIFALERELKV